MLTVNKAKITKELVPSIVFHVCFDSSCLHMYAPYAHRQTATVLTGILLLVASIVTNQPNSRVM